MFKLTVRSLILTTISPLAFATPALAQQNQQVAQEAPDSQVQEATPDESTIVVTGTRRADRTVADSPVPVDVIGSDAISNSGQTETSKILNQLVPSFNFPQPSIADGSDALRPATLRGLAPDQTLVLINGKRRHVSSLLNINGTVGRGSAAVDMNLIPGLAISRVEVLRDGAAAQYGSDAIAGVINVQLKSARHGGRASMTYGKYVTTVNDVDRVTGLQLNSAGLPVIEDACQAHGARYRGRRVGADVIGGTAGHVTQHPPSASAARVKVSNSFPTANSFRRWRCPAEPFLRATSSAACSNASLSWSLGLGTSPSTASRIAR